MSGCSCIRVSHDGNAYQEIEWESRTATEETTCCECGRSIHPGEEYEHFVGESEPGEIDTYHTCSDCLSIRSSFFCGDWNFEMILEDLGEHVYEVQGEISSDCLLGLTPRARSMVLSMIDEVFDETAEEEEP